MSDTPKSNGPTLVPFKPGGNCSDIVRCMRNLADEVESGKIVASSVICLVEDEIDDMPVLYQWGQSRTFSHMAGQFFELATRVVRYQRAARE